LNTTFSSLAGKGDPTANAYVQPVAGLIGAIGQMVLEHKRDQMIAASVEKATPEVNSILNQIKADFENIFTPLLSTGESERLSDLIKAYNDDAPNLSFEQRQARLKQVHDAVKSRSMALASIPSSLVTSISGAHDALVRVATARNRKPKDFDEFNAALEVWTDRIQYAAAQIKALMI
jgi:hypothetical protein